MNKPVQFGRGDYFFIAKGKKKYDTVNWETEIDIYTLLCIK